MAPARSFEPKPNVPKPSEVGGGNVNVVLDLSDDGKTMRAHYSSTRGNHLPQERTFMIHNYGPTELRSMHIVRSGSDKDGTYNIQLTDKFRNAEVASAEASTIGNIVYHENEHWVAPRRAGHRGRTARKIIGWSAVGVGALWALRCVVPLIANAIVQQQDSNAASYAPKPAGLEQSALGTYRGSNLADKVQYTPANQTNNATNR